MENRFLRRLRSNKGQTTLELAAVLILLFLIVGSITKIWLWGNNQLVGRQRNYEWSRVKAGTGSDFYITPRLQTYIPAPLLERDVLIKH